MERRDLGILFARENGLEEVLDIARGGREESSRHEIPPRPIVGTASSPKYYVYAGGHGCSHRTLVEVGMASLEAKVGKPLLQ